MKLVSKFARVVMVIVGAIVITALGIDAADTLTGSRSTLLSQVIRSNGGSCPSGMIEVTTIPGIRCVDVYEASPHRDCPEHTPSQMLATQKNIERPECTPISITGALPWRFITRDQALQMCARVGKRLPSSEEWYSLALGMTTDATSCNLMSKSIAETGSYTVCQTPHGAYDVVGNVWEWVRDDVIDGTYNGRALPPSGYVTQVDSGGVATAVGSSSDPLFNDDYFWSREDGAYGIIRGGYYDSGTDGGTYSVHTATIPTTASAGIGFRCVL